MYRSQSSKSIRWGEDAKHVTCFILEFFPWGNDHLIWVGEVKNWVLRPPLCSTWSWSLRQEDNTIWQMSTRKYFSYFLFMSSTAPLVFSLVYHITTLTGSLQLRIYLARLNAPARGETLLRFLRTKRCSGRRIAGLSRLSSLARTRPMGAV